MTEIVYRKAKPNDSKSILELINHYSMKGLMLPRSYTQIVEKIRDFTVGINDGQIVGVVALHPVSEEMGEIRSLAVLSTHQRHGIGKKLIEYCIKDSISLELNRVFTLTYQIDFFKKLQFNQVERLTLPQKIWADCIHCAKFSDCDEVAMIRHLEL
jgi:amino-acid N-acetyltransferase